jgi:hypothetical protein
MFRLFAEFPRYKEIWPQLKAIPDSAIISSTELQVALACSELYIALGTSDRDY